MVVIWTAKKRGYTVCTGNYVATNTRKSGTSQMTDLDSTAAAESVAALAGTQFVRGTIHSHSPRDVAQWW
jgi:hypothetical protein